MNLSNVLNNMLDLVAEGLNQPLDVNLIKTDDGYTGKFEIEENVYMINIIETSENCFVFKFDRDGSYTMVNDVKKSFQVIPTIKKVAEDFILKYNPNMFSFFMTDGSKGRNKMYTTFMNEISKKYGYKNFN